MYLMRGSILHIIHDSTFTSFFGPPKVAKYLQVRLQGLYNSLFSKPGKKTVVIHPQCDPGNR